MLSNVCNDPVYWQLDPNRETHVDSRVPTTCFPCSWALSLGFGSAPTRFVSCTGGYQSIDRLIITKIMNRISQQCWTRLVSLGWPQGFFTGGGGYLITYTFLCARVLKKQLSCKSYPIFNLIEDAKCQQRTTTTTTNLSLKNQSYLLLQLRCFKHSLITTTRRRYLLHAIWFHKYYFWKVCEVYVFVCARIQKKYLVLERDIEIRTFFRILSFSKILVFVQVGVFMTVWYNHNVLITRNECFMEV